MRLGIATLRLGQRFLGRRLRCLGLGRPAACAAAPARSSRAARPCSREPIALLAALDSARSVSASRHRLPACGIGLEQPVDGPGSSPRASWLSRPRCGSSRRTRTSITRQHYRRGPSRKARSSQLVGIRELAVAGAPAHGRRRCRRLAGRSRGNARLRRAGAAPSGRRPPAPRRCDPRSRSRSSSGRAPRRSAAIPAGSG